MLSNPQASDQAEVNRLFEALAVAISRASTLLQQRSVYDPVYLEADIEVTKILTLVSELLNRIRDDANHEVRTKAYG
jgi:hypothetical protein